MATVLVIDDEDVLLEMIATLIEEAGHRALTATNGAEALDLLHMEKEPPALIVSDVMMPRLNGIELARVIKNDAKLRYVPVILMSAAGRPSHENSADDFLHKPFDLDVLESLIQQYTERSRC
jgi:two-component system sensor histidine kinase/response regulator